MNKHITKFFIISSALLSCACFVTSCMGKNDNPGGEIDPPTPKKTLTAFTVEGTPNKKNYFTGESFDPTGLSFTATFSDDSSAQITSSVVFEPDPLTAGTTSVTAKYTYGTITLSRQISGLTVADLGIEDIIYTGTLTKSVYTHGDTFDPSGLSFTVKYSNNTTENVSNSSLIFNNGQVLSAGQTSVSVTFNKLDLSKTIQLTGITVKNVLLNLKKEGSLTKTTYYEGDPFSLAGLNFIAEYKDGSSKNVNDSISINVNKLQLTTTSVKASYTYEGVTKSIDITGFTVLESPLSSLTMSGTLTKSVYNVGDTFDPSGLTFTAHFANSSTKNVTNNVTFSPTTLSLQTSVVVASYTQNGVTKTVNITDFEVKNILTNLTLSGSLTKTTYIVGETLDLTGLTITATFKDGSTSNVTSSVSLSVTQLALTTTSVVASYTYEGVTKSVTITGFTVRQATLLSISVSGALTNSYYYDGETFDPSGLTITAHFENNVDVDVTSSATFTPSTLSYDTTKVTFSYTNNNITKTVDFTEFTMDNPFEFESAIDFEKGSVSVESDNRTISYKLNSSDTKPTVQIKSTTSSSLFENVSLSPSTVVYPNRGNSLIFTKTQPGSTYFFLSQEFIDQIGDAQYAFDFYSSVYINSKSNVTNFLDGNGHILNPNGAQVVGEKWRTFVFDKTSIRSDGCFLNTNGSSQGTYCLDNIRIINQNTYTNGGTFYFGKIEENVIPTGNDLKFATKLSLDDIALQSSDYSISESNIILNNISNGEHKLTYMKKVGSLSATTHSIYFGAYKSTLIANKSLTLEYGSQNYQTLTGYTSVNRVICNGKSIAFEKSGSNILIPDSALIECLNESQNKKQSGSIKLFIISNAKNASCVEMNVNITLSGDSTILTTRTYTTEENYHSFGYSSTGGGKLNDYLYTEDMFMSYDRSGLDNIYDQLLSISGDINENSFTQGGSLEYIGKEFELCEKLGKKVYIIDSFLRNVIEYSKVQVFNSSGALLGTVNYSPTIDDDTSSKNTFKSSAASQLGIPSSSISSWKRYQKPAYGPGTSYPDFESYVQAIVNRLNVYKKYNALEKIVICDEPRYYNLETVGQIYKALKEGLRRVGREDIEIDANLLPISAGYGYTDGDGLGNVSDSFSGDTRNYKKRAAIYDQYLTKFLDETGADYISYDAYPLWDGSPISFNLYYNSVDEHAYSNLIKAAEFAKAHNVELHVVTEAYTAVTRNSNQNRRTMSAEDMRWLCNQLMGFGVTRVSFFTYFNRAVNSNEFRWDNADPNSTVGCMKIEHITNGEVDSIETTDVYYSIQGELEEMNEFSNVALNFSYSSCHMITGSSVTYKQEPSSLATDKSPVKWAQQLDSDTFEGEISSMTVDKEYCLTSTLKDKDGNYMYMIQNCCDPKYNTLQTDTITFKSGTYVAIYENSTKRIVKLNSNKLTLKLSAGHAAFIMVY